MGKGRRVKTERRRRRTSDKLQFPSLQNYPEGVPNYLRRMSTNSGEVLAEDQEWITLPKKSLALHLDPVDSEGITATVNDKFQISAIPFCVEQLSFKKKDYKECKLVKGVEKDFAVNKTDTFHIGTAKYYRTIKSKNRGQRDPNEGSIFLGPCDIEWSDIEGTENGAFNADVSVNYDKGYLYSCSVLEKGEVEPQYDTYTVFNASPQRVALALGADVGNHLTKKAVKISGVPKIRVFYGKVQYIDNKNRTQNHLSAEITNRRSDLAAIFTKTPDYSHQKEFRFFITLDDVQWDFESHPSLVVPMSWYFQFHFGYTYWADEREQNRNLKKEDSAH